jgi:hypothetical protein
MNRPGRKPLIPGVPMTRHVVTLDEMTIRKLRVLGVDNLSRGVRVAAKTAYDRHQKDDPISGDADGVVDGNRA